MFCVVIIPRRIFSEQRDFCGCNYYCFNVLHRFISNQIKIPTNSFRRYFLCVSFTVCENVSLEFELLRVLRRYFDKKL